MIGLTLPLVLLAGSFLTAGPSDATAAKDPSVESILSRAAAAQQAGEYASGVKDLHVHLYLQVRDPDKGRVEFDIERKYRAPDRLWTRLEDSALSGVSQQDGFDGKLAWNLDEKTDEVVKFEGPEFRADRNRIQQDLKTMGRLVKFFFLENLVGEIREVERLPDGSSEDGSLRSFVISGLGDLGEEAGGTKRITVWIDQRTHYLLGARVEPVDEGKSEDAEGAEATTSHRKQDVTQFCFWHHRPTPQGIVVPGSVKIYVNDEPQPSQEISIRTVEGEDGEDLNEILFNVGLDDDEFGPPD